jgi:restriction system protein
MAGSENRVARILREAGLRVQQKKPLTIAHGTVEIDVFAQDESINPPITMLVECKHWKRPIPKSVVHAFRQVVTDSGANVGLIVSLNGFQVGAESAASLSNIHLVDWYIFQSLFAERWYHNYMREPAYAVIEPLDEYTEPINSRIFRKAGTLPEPRQAEFGRLREEHRFVPAVLTRIFTEYPIPGLHDGVPVLPLRRSFSSSDPRVLEQIPVSILDASSFRGLFNAIVEYCTEAVGEFDEVFGERA